MTERPPKPGDSGAESHTYALLGLHKMAGDFEGVEVPGLRPSSIGTQLRAVAEAPEHEISQSARLAVLHSLAEAGFPGREAHAAEYRMLAETVAGPQNVDSDRLLDDLRRSVETQTPFRESEVGRNIDHHVAAFIGENVCHIRRVEVNGLPATWIFSEFETDAPFDGVANWVDPRNWPQRGPMLFKKMDLVGSATPTPIAALSEDHWHGVFHEQVQLIDRVDTLLHCDYWEDGESAGMTYDLAISLDNALEVDRGFLLVNDLGDMRRVKALKIVGFTDRRWDRTAQLVCPYWTDWVRRAVEGGSSSTPTTPTGEPTGTPGGSSGPIEDLMKAWVEFFGDAAGEYIELFSDVFDRTRAGGYSLSDWLEDGTRYWDRLARDWAKAWAYGIDLLDDVAEGGLASDFSPPDDRQEERARPLMATAAAGAAANAEGTLVPVRGLRPEDGPRCTELVSIESGGFTISPSDIQLSVEQLADGTYGVRISTAADAPPGLYVGRLSSADGRTLSPLQLYLSRATSRGATGP
ncbi:MAG TPA: hypothetical protein VK011_03325 [Acidimicrobiia bacterium]|nr:hypothetical protein [Acidimicrobiia bacterium]